VSEPGAGLPAEAPATSGSSVDGAKVGISLRDVVGLVTGAGAAYGIVAAASPILTRLYSPADFGQFQIYITVFSFLLIVAAWRFEVAVLLPKEDRGGVEVAVLGLTAVLVMCAATAIAWAGLAAAGALHGRLEVLARHGWILPAAVAGGGVTAVMMQWALREGDYRGVSIARITQSSTIAATQVVAAFTPAGGAGLAIGDAAGRLAGSATLLWRGWRSHGAIARQVRASDLRAMLVRYWRFPVISSGSALLNTAGIVLPTWFLSAFGDAPLGWFALIDRMIGAPSALVGLQISQVYAAKAAKLAHEDPRGLRVLFRDLMVRLALTGALPFVALGLAGPWIFAFVFGEDWRPAGQYAQFLALMQYIGFFVWPLMPTLNILEHQHWQLAWDIGRLVVTAGLMAAGARFGGSPQWVVAGYAAGMSAGYVSHAALSYAAIHRRVREAAAC
jgi:O-antigen/teichoic acid export membrane protein